MVTTVPMSILAVLVWLNKAVHNLFDLENLTLRTLSASTIEVFYLLLSSLGCPIAVLIYHP